MRNTLCKRFPPGMLRACALGVATLAVLAWLTLAPRALSATAHRHARRAAQGRPSISATLEQCVTSTEQAERSATFSGEMTALPGTAKMEMRIDLLERQPRELAFHTVTTAGLGAWRTSTTGVKTYKYLKQVTNLTAPAYYRGAVRFRWLNARGRIIRSAELRTPRCLQTVPSLEQPLGGQGQVKAA